MENDVLVMLKVAERCNINCRYCYMYNGVDQSWKHRPKFLCDDDLDQVVYRMNEYHRHHPEARLTLEIHGGEPLLMGKKRMAVFLEKIRKGLPKDQLFICAQTNGTLVDREWLSIFQDHEATLSISCDGPPDAHNAHRVSHSGDGTSDAVEKGIRICLGEEWQDVFNGVLSVVDPNFNGAGTVAYFYQLGVKNFDFLLPDSNYLTPPNHIKNYSHQKMSAFLESAFDQWTRYQEPGFRIRMFETFMLGMLGQKPDLDAYGGDLSPILVVESDGSYRLLDVLSICEDGVAKTPLSVQENTVDEFLKLSRGSYPANAGYCTSCPAYATCGGGYLAHRYDGVGYDNPSFYCPVLFDLYRYISAYLSKVIPQEIMPAGIDLPSLDRFRHSLAGHYSTLSRRREAPLLA